MSIADHFPDALKQAVEAISSLLPRKVCKEQAITEASDNEVVAEGADEPPETASELPETDEEEDDTNTGTDVVEPEKDKETQDVDTEENSEELTKAPASEQTTGPQTIPSSEKRPAEALPTAINDDLPTNDVVTLSFTDSLLEVAALGFISSLLPIKNIRNEILANKDFVRACCALATYMSDAVLQQEAVLMLVKLAPFVSNETLGFALSNELLAATFLGVLKSEYEPKAKDETTSARLRSRVVSGLLCIFDCLTSNTQVEILRQVVSRLNIIIKGCAVSRTAKSDVQRVRDIGELACSLSYLMIHARGVLLTGKIVSPQLLTTLAHVIQWRFDPKTVLQEAEIQFWNATATHSVLLMSSFVTGSQQSLDAVGIKLGGIPGIVLMVARPGKAPRKAIDFSSALQKLIEVGDAAAAVAAQRILDRLAA